MDLILINTFLFDTSLHILETLYPQAGQMKAREERLISIAYDRDSQLEPNSRNFLADIFTLGEHKGSGLTKRSNYWKLCSSLHQFLKDVWIWIPFRYNASLFS